ncbi:SGNH/GDSL hydrolase family protein [Leifsonia bigeumensis]|uniref:SGNH/GDSL hydrolase family protein n=1 Tax=Leifsonella bigeumensis TaxID=433643 RepID=A0ABP7EZQ3_9MICO
MKRLSRVVAIPLAPVLIAQARDLRRTIPRLPDAALPWSGELAGPRPVRLLVLGDSTAAGVGASTQAEALPGNLAQAIRSRFDRGSVWEAAGRNGATARDLLTDYLEEATRNDYDLVFVTIGANDALGLRSRRAFSHDVAEIVERMREASPSALILVSLMPRFDRFASLRNPVRWNLALHAASLDEGARRAVDGRPGVFAIPKPDPYTPEFWAGDDFHPSAEGYRQWVDFALREVPDDLLARFLA